jgi:hypothetical protein
MYFNVSIIGLCVDMGIDSAPNVEALSGSAEADFRRGISGKFFLGEIFWEADIEIDSE